MENRASTNKRVIIMVCFAKTKYRDRPKLRKTNIPKPAQDTNRDIEQVIKNRKGTSKYKVGSS